MCTIYVDILIYVEKECLESQQTISVSLLYLHFLLSIIDSCHHNIHHIFDILLECGTVLHASRMYFFWNWTGNHETFNYNPLVLLNVLDDMFEGKVTRKNLYQIFQGDF